MFGPKTHGGSIPSSTPHEATFAVGQAAGARGRAPRQRAGRDQRAGEEGWPSVSRHKTWEMLLRLIRVNAAAKKKEKFRSMGKVKVQKFNLRSEGGRVWVEQTGEKMPVVLGHSKAHKTFYSNSTVCDRLGSLVSKCISMSIINI